MLRKIILIASATGLATLCAAQQKAAPEVKVNMINACAPSPEDKQQIASALALVPRQPKFGPDFEVDRGRSTLDEKPDFLQAAVGGQVADALPGSANWVRVRREFPAQAMFSTVQYSFSTDPKTMVETLVFRVRDPKDLLELTIEDSASAVTTPGSMLSANTPASRIKLERFGKSSVVLARCYVTATSPAPDQSAYEPLFQSATAIVSGYRGWLGVRHTVPEELARVGSHSASETKTSPKKHAGTKPSIPDK